MAAQQDYVYRYSTKHLPTSGRCRVRVYARRNGDHTVLLTELDDNPGEPITNVCEQLATDLTGRWKLNVKTTRWIQHDTTEASPFAGFEEIRFSWDDKQRASHPQWQGLGAAEVEALTGTPITLLEIHIGETGV